ncbi:peptidase [Calderihabitans maritimus]|uniref:Peptidase n=1 Tax=Calderihabitans maritimus TaxID=1246530 RepID=A0A1Z5HQS6_9FIRM|nr:peptidase [Calderihabitans maritimus]
MNVEATGYWVSEEDQPEKVVELLEKNPADILILTGHDGFLKRKSDFSNLDNYRTSRYFVEAVKKIRRIIPSKDTLVIFAGACQSHYEAILKAGANFASSPMRALIHALDPVFVAEKVAHTPISEIIPLEELTADTITGAKGIGGIETKGRLRMAYPQSPY